MECGRAFAHELIAAVVDGDGAGACARGSSWPASSASVHFVTTCVMKIDWPRALAWQPARPPDAPPPAAEARQRLRAAARAARAHAPWLGSSRSCRRGLLAIGASLGARSAHRAAAALSSVAGHLVMREQVRRGGEQGVGRHLWYQ